MPNLAAALKTEIARIARKEVRTETESLRKIVSQQRAHIASLRRQLDVVERDVRRAAKGKRLATMESSSEGGETSLRFRSSGFASHRQRLGLSAADMGRLLGVSGQSVYKWESGEVKPRRGQLEAIASIRKLGRREVAARLASSS